MCTRSTHETRNTNIASAYINRCYMCHWHVIARLSFHTHIIKMKFRIIALYMVDRSCILHLHISTFVKTYMYMPRQPNVSESEPYVTGWKNENFWECCIHVVVVFLFFLCIFHSFGQCCRCHGCFCWWRTNVHNLALKFILWLYCTHAWARTMCDV